jgi:maltose/maltodextrin transport system permease protein
MSAVSSDLPDRGLPSPNRPVAAGFALRQRLWRLLVRTLGVLMLAGALYVTTLFYLSGEVWLALASLTLTCFGAWAYLHPKAEAYRFLFPALASVFVFILLPIGYMVNLGFTNTSGSNLLTYDKVRDYLLQETYEKSEGAWSFKIFKDGGAYRLVLEGDGGTGRFVTPGLSLAPGSNISQTLEPAPAEVPGAPLAMKDMIPLRDTIAALALKLPDGTQLKMSGLRSFSAKAPLYRGEADGSLTDMRNGETLTPDFKTGFFTRPGGQTVTPGFSVYVGFGNYLRIVTMPGLWQPFLQIFAWTLAFALLSTLFVFSIGVVLATILQWDSLKGRALYRTLVILPYAVPNFISIQIFRGLFNQEFGEVNLILQNLLGIKPEWMTDPWLARGMLLMVNAWLGYPYMMILAIGLLQAVPKDMYEAAAVDGSGPVRNFFKITLPVILPPFVPLLIACFAFNYNNFVLIALLTRGLPDYLGASTPAGTTDLLVTYTYRIAFQNSGQAYGLASAISVLIFIMVAVIALVNLHYARKHKMIA